MLNFRTTRAVGGGARHKRKEGFTAASWISIALLTLLFGGAYAGLRALPGAHSGFLNYEEVETAGGEREYCATNHATFLNLEKLNYPVRMRISGPDPLVPGETAKMEVTLLTPGGQPLPPHKLAVSHTERIHLMLVDPSLEDYHHVHPSPKNGGGDGKYVFAFTPRRAGTYRVFADLVPLLTRRQAVAQSTVDVRGGAEEARFSRNVTARVEDLRFTLKGVPDRIKTGRDHRFELVVRDGDGDRVELEEIMGARGHLVAFDARKKGFAHMHPEGNLAYVKNRAKGGGERPANEPLRFYFNVPDTGWYRVFAQVKIDGRELFPSFDLRVRG